MQFSTIWTCLQTGHLHNRQWPNSCHNYLLMHLRTIRNATTQHYISQFCNTSFIHEYNSEHLNSVVTIHTSNHAKLWLVKTEVLCCCIELVNKDSNNLLLSLWILNWPMRAQKNGFSNSFYWHYSYMPFQSWIANMFS